MPKFISIDNVTSSLLHKNALLSFKSLASSSVATYRKSSNYSVKKFNSNLQLAPLLEPKNTSKVASGA